MIVSMEISNSSNSGLDQSIVSFDSAGTQTITHLGVWDEAPNYDIRDWLLHLVSAPWLRDRWQRPKPTLLATHTIPATTLQVGDRLSISFRSTLA